MKIRPHRKTAIEERRLSAEHAQHHDESRGGHSSGVVIGDDPGVVPDSCSAHCSGEIDRIGKGMASSGGRMVVAVREISIDVDEHRIANSRLGESNSRISSVCVPPNIGEDDRAR